MYENILKELEKRKTFSDRQKSPLYIPELLTEDNKKLVSNDKVKFMRWNIPAGSTCPFKCKACDKACYAKKAERVYPNAKKSRRAALRASKRPDFVDRMIYTILVHVARPVFKNKKVVIRIHESGDFYSVEYLKAWLQIIDYFKSNKKIIFCAYTKSIPYLHACGLYSMEDIKSNYPGLVLSASIWSDMTAETVQTMYKFKTYTAATAAEIAARKAAGDKIHVCRCNNCGSCLACMTNKVKNTICLIH